MTVTGTCRLCLTVDAELLESHIMPAWVYKRARATGDGSQPYVFREGRIFHPSKQEKEHLLCKTCENRFGVAETYVSQITWKPGRPCTLLELAGAPSGTDVSFDREHLAVFGLSVFWRAAVWKGGSIRLGPYEIPLRRFLLGEEELDRHIGLMVHAIDTRKPTQANFSKMVAFPGAGRQKAGFHAYEFVVFGLCFQMLVGKSVPRELMKSCIVGSTEPGFFVTSPDKIGVLQVARDALNAWTPVGRAAKTYRRPST